MNFRRVVTALAVLALFAGLASAQLSPPTTLSCTVSADTSPSIRAEGIAERVGDVKLTCTIPVQSTPNTSVQADRANITVNYQVPVTSRLLSNAGNEALLTIDEPGTNSLGVSSGFGPNAGISVCGSDVNPCAAWPVAVGTSGAYGIATLQGGSVNAANAYQGVVGTTSSTNSTVTFNNVPIVSPGTTTVQRVFRITNIRVTPGTSAVVATVGVTPVGSAGTILSLSNNGVTVATPAASITTTVGSILGAASLCVKPVLYDSTNPQYTKANVAMLTFKEAFNNAFKTRVLPLTGNAGDAQSIGSNQMSVSGSYSPTIGGKTVSMTLATSESGTIAPFTAGTAGLADSGTRLKAVFTGLDKNATYYVSINNVTDFATSATAPAGVGDSTSTPWAVLLGNGTAKETATYGAASGTAFGNGTGSSPTTGVPVVAITNTSGAGEVVWEVTNTKAGQSNTFNFAIYATYNPAVSSTTPTVGNTATVTLGYAPTTGSATTTPVGYTTTAIPRFTAPSMTPANFFNVVLCQTSLLFPYVTNANGFETGLAVSNTSSDPFGTVATTGACNLYFYGANQPSGAITLTSPAGASTIGAGQQISNTVSGLGLSGFQGYTIAVCNFQYGHGFAFLQTTKGTLSMGYLPLVMNTTGRGLTLVGETFGQ